jgi:hydroxyacylglutathione hydrolase
LKDNYAYLVICEDTNKAAIVDPSEADPVAAAVKSEGVELAAIWNTHHHWDHTGGNKDLLNDHPELEVVGHVSDKGRIPGQTTFAEEGDTVEVGNVSARIIHNPGHTTGAISFYIDSPHIVFTGDTLFTGGCGRLFEGTPAMMYESMSKLGALPGDTLVYCGHEYTQSNLRFAARVEPASKALAERAEKVDAMRQRGEPTVPSTMADELATNPFMRSTEPAVIAAAKQNEPPPNESPAEILGAIRRWKDRG